MHYKEKSGQKGGVPPSRPAPVRPGPRPGHGRPGAGRAGPGRDRPKCGIFGNPLSRDQENIFQNTTRCAPESTETPFIYSNKFLILARRTGVLSRAALTFHSWAGFRNRKPCSYTRPLERVGGAAGGAPLAPITGRWVMWYAMLLFLPRNTTFFRLHTHVMKSWDDLWAGEGCYGGK